jgi:hypothetical protein
MWSPVLHVSLGRFSNVYTAIGYVYWMSLLTIVQFYGEGKFYRWWKREITTELTEVTYLYTLKESSWSWNACIMYTISLLIYIKGVLVVVERLYIIVTFTYTYLLHIHVPISMSCLSQVYLGLCGSRTYNVSVNRHWLYRYVYMQKICICKCNYDIQEYSISINCFHRGLYKEDSGIINLFIFISIPAGSSALLSWSQLLISSLQFVHVILQRKYHSFDLERNWWRLSRYVSCALT